MSEKSGGAQLPSQLIQGKALEELKRQIYAEHGYPESNADITSDMETSPGCEVTNAIIQNQVPSWTLVATKKRKLDRAQSSEAEAGLMTKKSKNFPNITQEDISNTNKFSLLSSLNDTNPHTVLPKKGNLPNSHKVDKSVKKVSGAPPQTKRSYCPPIIISNPKTIKLTEIIKASWPQLDFKISNLKGNACKLYVDNPSIHRTIFEELKKNKIEAITYTPKSLRNVTLILKGLDHEYDPTEVKEELINLVPGITINSVKHFATKKNPFLNMFLVNLPINQPFKPLTSVRLIFNTVIVWDKLRKEGIIQCHNCQKFGHVAVNCSRSYKCVKCNEQHTPGNCNRKQTDKDSSPPYCVNCDSYGHTANYRGCPVYKNVLNIKNSVKTPLPQLNLPAEDRASRSESYNKKYSPNAINKTTYADILKDNSDNNDEFFELSRELFNIDFATLAGKINAFLNIFHSEKSFANKQSMYLQFCFSILKNGNRK